MGKASGHGKVRGLESNRLGNPVGLALGLRVSSVAGLGWLCRDSQAVVRLGLRCPGGREGVSSQCQPVLSTILFTLVLLRPPSASVSLGADVCVVFGECAHQIRLSQVSSFVSSSEALPGCAPPQAGLFTGSTQQMPSYVTCCLLYGFHLCSQTLGYGLLWIPHRAQAWQK